MVRLLPVLLSKEAEEVEEVEVEEASPVLMPGEAEVRGSATTKEDFYSAP